MSGNAGFHIQTIIILALFALVFGCLYFSNRHQKFSGWIALGYTAALTAYVLDSIRTSSTPVGLVFFSASLFWIFSLAIAKAIHVRCKAVFPNILAALILVAAIATFILLTFVAPDITARSMLVNVVAGILLALSLPPLWKTSKTRIDRALFGVVAAVVATFIVRVVIIFILLGMTITEQSYAHSTYTWIFHFSSGICGLALAVVLFYAAGNDVILHFYGQSHQDPLTGLLNRRGLKRLFDECPDKNQSAIYVRSLILFDIDLFKQVNDQYGHLAGDKILQRIAKTASGHCREYGQIARTGGEEFAILTHWIPVETAQFLAQHICDSLRFIAHPELDSNQKVTASFGLAILSDADTLDEAMERADKALYHAKRNGRNQVARAKAA